MLLAFALLAAQASAAGSSPYPLSQVLDASRRVCDDVLAGDDFPAIIQKAGWLRASPEPGSWLDRTLREMPKMFGPQSAPQNAYIKEVAGQKLVVFAIIVQSKGGVIRSCSAQDPNADIDAPGRQIIAWATQPPFDPGLGLSDKLQQGFDDLTFSRSWKPGLNLGSEDTIIRYIPQQFSNGDGGLIFTSERIEGTDTK